MPPDLDAELKQLKKKAIPELLIIYREVFGEPSASRSKPHLIRRIAWGLQAQGEHSLSVKALRRVTELIDPHDLRVCSATNQPGQAQKASRTPIPGTIITRLYKGELLEIRVHHEGFEFRGQRFQSLSALAKHITGSHWNGNLFFGIQSPPKGRQP